MKFSKTPPADDGYYFVLDTHYPLVKISYVYRRDGFVWIHGFDRGDDFSVCVNSPMRFGDKVKTPHPVDCEIEY